MPNHCETPFAESTLLEQLGIGQEDWLVPENLDDLNTTSASSNEEQNGFDPLSFLRDTTPENVINPAQTTGSEPLPESLGVPTNPVTHLSRSAGPGPEGLSGEARCTRVQWHEEAVPVQQCGQTGNGFERCEQESHIEIHEGSALTSLRLRSGGATELDEQANLQFVGVEELVGDSSVELDQTERDLRMLLSSLDPIAEVKPFINQKPLILHPLDGADAVNSEPLDPVIEMSNAGVNHMEEDSLKIQPASAPVAPTSNRPMLRLQKRLRLGDQDHVSPVGEKTLPANQQ